MSADEILDTEFEAADIDSDNAEDMESIRQLALYGDIFYQMMNLEWFRDIIDASFTIQKVVDEETKTLHVQVLEVPPEVKIQRLNEQMRKREAAQPKIVAPTGGEVIKFNRNG